MSTHVLDQLQTKLLYPRLRLVVVDGPDLGKIADDEAGELACGTGPGNQLTLTDPTVSRHHLVLSATPRGVHMRDVGSTNGVLLAGQRIESAWLEPGATLRIGITTVRFEHGGPLVDQPLSPDAQFGEAHGRSPVMRRLFALLPQIAGATSNVLLLGETGTGKTLIARAIHEAGPRARKPFVVVDCGAIPPSLIESELFGHEKGAFTGATTTRIGAIEAAAGGTLFFDEIGELPIELQPRLLRAIEDRTIKRVGGNEAIRVDARVIAATHRDLRDAINRGAFRGDLYYRLNIVGLRVPPLRERREDIPLLVERFFEQLTGQPHAPQALVDEMSRLEWPGNVRELRGAIERAALLGDPALWRDLQEAPATSTTGEPDTFDPELSFRAAKTRAVARWERWYVSSLLAHHGHELRPAARGARMDRTHLRELARRYGIRDPEDG